MSSDSNDKSLFKFDFDSKAVIHLLDKIEKAAGWVVTHDTPRRRAVKIFNESIENSDLPLLDKCAYISHSNQIIKEYSNHKDIVSIVVENLKCDSKPEKVDDMWIGCFFDKTRIVSDKEFKQIWGRILAEECNFPGSVSRSLLYSLEQMDKEDASKFLELSACSVELWTENETTYSPIISSYEGHYFWKSKICYDSLLRLKNLGLIEFSLGNFDADFSISFECPHDITAVYFDESFKFPRGTTEVTVGRVVFTKNGALLRKIVSPKKYEGYFSEICMSMWKPNTDKSISVDFGKNII